MGDEKRIAGSLFATAGSAEPPDQARNDETKLHPGHQAAANTREDLPRPDGQDKSRPLPVHAPTQIRRQERALQWPFCMAEVLPIDFNVSDG